MAGRRFLSSSDLTIMCPALALNLTTFLRSFTFNAAINAFELRAPRPEEGPMIPELAGKGPLVVTVRGEIEFRVHFETVSRIPVEFDVRRMGQDTCVEELVILRGVHIES